MLLPVEEVVGYCSVCDLTVNCAATFNPYYWLLFRVYDEMKKGKIAGRIVLSMD